jgi:hypothetical protein
LIFATNQQLKRSIDRQAAALFIPYQEDRMVQFGYKLMTEEHGPAALIENSLRAERAGFDFVSISDHFHPWLEAQGHAPFAWSVIGGIAQATSRIGIATGLTCPIIRYHPAIIAQAAATIALMSDGRFTLAVGAGERLNEHVTGDRWPSTPERHAMLEQIPITPAHSLQQRSSWRTRLARRAVGRRGSRPKDQ